jgi:hypothetical protein
MATDMHCNIKPGEGIFYRCYKTMGTLGDVVTKSEQLVNDVDYGWLEFDEATAERIPLYETTVSSQTILTTEVNGSPVAYSYAVPVANSLPLFQMKEISSGTYVLSTDPYAVCSKMPFENLYDPGDPKYSTYQNRVVYRPYDDNTEWIGLLGYVVPTAQATQPADCQPLSEILGEQILFAPGEKQDCDELLIWTGQSPPPPTNNAPVFSSDPIVMTSLGTLAGTATDADSDPLTYSKVIGPSWLNIAADGTLSGTPNWMGIDMNTWSVRVSDGNGGFDTATLQIFITNEVPIVQWGLQTDILPWNIDGAAGSVGTTYNGTTVASPANADYYASPADEGRTPVFYGAGSKSRNVEMRNVETGDQIWIHGYVPPDSTYRGMFVWKAEDFLDSKDISRFELHAARRNTSDISEIRWVVEKNSNWYISEVAGVVDWAGFIHTISSAASMTWYEFTPFVNGTETIGQAAQITMDGVTSAGFYWDTFNNNSGSSNWVGAIVRYFAVTSIDVTPPTPNQATWATEPYAVGDNAITMVATTGSDDNGPVEYLFTETSGNHGATSSSWQTSPNYTDSGLDAGTQYTYTVQMRDAFANTGTASSPANATGYNRDINGDGSVELKDFAKLAIWWKNDQCQTFVDCLDADINSDGIVDIMDLKIFTQRWLDSD